MLLCAFLASVDFSPNLHTLAGQYLFVNKWQQGIRIDQALGVPTAGQSAG
jgi:hypothetical protein